MGQDDSGVASATPERSRTPAVPPHEQLPAHNGHGPGVDHSEAVALRDDLASAHPAPGEPERAAAPHEQALATGEQTPDKPITRGDLAQALHGTRDGDPERAILHYQRNLAIDERVLGGDHPHTLLTRGSLAGACREAGDLRRAIPLYEQAIADSERVLGSDHQITLSLRGNLAVTYQLAGNLEQAIPLYEQILAERERSLGSHPRTRTARKDLAHAYVWAGEFGRAIPLYDQLLTEETFCRWA